MARDQEQFLTLISANLSQHEDPYLKHMVAFTISPESIPVPEENAYFNFESFVKCYNQCTDISFIFDIRFRYEACLRFV